MKRNLTKYGARKLRERLDAYRLKILDVSIGMADYTNQPVDISRRIDEANEAIELAITQLDEWIDGDQKEEE